MGNTGKVEPSDFKIDSYFESRREQYWPSTAFEFSPLYMQLVLPCARELYRLLSYKAWAEKSLVVVGAQSYLAKRTGLGTGAIKRHLKTLRRYRLVRLYTPSLGRLSNEHFVEPLLIAEYEWPKLLHLSESRFFSFTRGGREEAVRFCGNYLDQNDPVLRDRLRSRLFPELDQNDPSTGSFWPSSERLLRTQLDQNDPQIYSLYSFLADDAQRYPPTTSPEGGAERPGDNEGPGQRSPNGQDRTSGKKGARAGRSERPPRKKKTEQKNREELIAQAREIAAADGMR